MACVISLLARKGGSGRTTLTINLASAFTADGLRVVTIDLDSQASLTQFYLGSNETADLRPAQTVLAAFAGQSAPVRPTRFNGVGLVPAHLEMAPEPHQRLDLRTIDADLVLVDTPPDTASPAVRAALLTSDFILSPVLPEPFGCQAIASLPALIRQAVQGGNPAVTLLGFVVSQRRRLSVHGAFEEIVRRVHGEAVFATVIESTAVYKEALAAGFPIGEFKPAGGKRALEPVEKAALAIRNLVGEIGERIAACMTRRAAA